MALTSSSSSTIITQQQHTSSSSQQQQKTSSSRRKQMGGCVTKNGAAALGGPMAPRAEQSKLSDQSGATSPSTRPSADEPTPPPPPGLRHRERRRLSLSQSDPVREQESGHEACRGHLLITPGLDAANIPAAAAAKPSSTAAKATKTTSTTAAATKGRKNASANIDDTSAEEGFLEGGEEEDRQHSQQRQPDNAATCGEDDEADSAAAAAAADSAAPKHCRRLSVTGLPSSLLQDNFESKRQEVKSDTGHFDSSTLHALGIGYACKKGLKPESPNQDDFFIIRIDDWGLYGVFDGHGPYGHDVSHYVQRELPKLIYNNRHFVTNPGEALRASFIAVHQMLENAAATHRMFDCSLSGCTATVVLHRKDRLWTAHVGDSRCVLGRLGKDARNVEALDLTIDHKPNNETEKRRITTSGGQVRRLDGDIPHRVFLKGKLYPGLAMSRAIGDTVGAQAGVICTPDVNEWVINPERDLFVTLCSDGVWEFLTSNEVVSVIQRNGPASVQASADTIARESWNRWIQEEGNVVDDITCEIVFF